MLIKPLIVFVDVDNRNVYLFGKYTRTVPFSHAFILPSLLNGESVFWISQFEQISGEDAISMIASLFSDDDVSKEKLYIRYRGGDTLRVNELKLTFSGPKDVKPLDKFGWDIFEKSPLLRKMLIEDKIDILTESETKIIKKRPDAKAKDKSLDDIVLKTSVKDAIEKKSMFGSGEGDEVPMDENAKVLTETEELLEKHKDWGKKDVENSPNS